MTNPKKKVVILGGGFAGVECARRLESLFRNDPEIELVLVSEDNFLLFTPMLPQVASGMIETRHIVMPIRTICKKATFYERRVRNIDPYKQTVNLWGTGEGRGLSLHYDLLVIALGSQTNFFGMSDVERHAYTMKTLNDAVTLRNRAIDMLEQAENEPSSDHRKSLLTFVIAGGGFAGVETAGELLDLLQDARKHYPTIRRNEISVIILEALPAILPGFSKALAAFAHEKMTERGIEIRLETAVTAFDGIRVSVKGTGGAKDTDTIQTRTLIWTAGIAPVNTIQRSVFRKEKGMIRINEFLEVDEFPGVFAIGDCAFLADPETGRPHPPTAQLAEAQAKTVATNLLASVRGGEKNRFAYKSKGQMAIIGKRVGIASIFGSNIAGFWAWALWRNVYLSKIPNMDKKIRVILDWVIDLFFDRDIARMTFLTKPGRREYKVLDEVDDVW